jgi:aldose 1-epimerase
MTVLLFTGAILVSVLVPDVNGVKKDVVLGYDHLEAWVSGKPWFNSIVGRHANRIAEGKFHLDGETFQLERNNHGNNVSATWEFSVLITCTLLSLFANVPCIHCYLYCLSSQLHSGAAGWNAKLMQSKEISGTDPAQGKYVGVEMSFTSPDGEDGFPGALDIVTSFRLFTDNTLHMDFRAKHQKNDQKPTIVSACNHAYWNLNGSDGRDTILQQELRVNAESVTELDGKETMLATGRIIPIADTPYDFRNTRTIGGEKLDALNKILPPPGGYDINYVLNKDHRSPPSNHPEQIDRFVTVDGNEVRNTFAARLHDPVSGRTMDVYTSAPGIQVYSGNFLDGSSIVGRYGVHYPKHAAVCLETQTFPGAITHAEEWKNYPSPVLRPGQTYVHTVQHKFSVTK